MWPNCKPGKLQVAYGVPTAAVVVSSGYIESTSGRGFAIGTEFNLSSQGPEAYK